MEHNFINKENGKVASVLVMYLDDEEHLQTDSYDKIEDLMEDYGAYEPAKPEPLIKDEKIRKAVRAWAEAVEIDDNKVAFNRYSNGFSYMGNEGLFSSISFDGRAFNLVDGELYTIVELFGEEEE